jgi:hypothetical protein
VAADPAAVAAAPSAATATAAAVIHGNRYIDATAPVIFVRT